MDEKTLVLIGDVIASREIVPRPAFNALLLAALAELNARPSGILSPYTLTIGDEFQAVFSTAEGLFSDAVSILAAVHPVKMRFSLGIGRLVTPINREQAIGMDGPAFHYARDAIETLKKSGDLFTISGDNIPYRDLLQQVLVLVSYNVKKWNKTRLRTMVMLQKGTPVKAIAATLQISEQAVYKTISAGALPAIADLLNHVETALNSALKDDK